MAPEVARRIAQDAFLSGVFYDGKDLRQLLRWSRNIPVEVAIALELGPPPDFAPKSQPYAAFRSYVVKR